MYYHGEKWANYDIVENYGKYGHTAGGIAPFSETREGLIQVLRDMLADAEHYRTLVEK
jgi:hypothetical protein